MSIETRMDRETLRYACGRAITYPECGHITDVKEAALLTTTSTVHLLHEKCFDVDGLISDLEANPEVEAFEMLRGKVLFK